VGQQAPSLGQVSPDGQSIWDGSQWNPITAFRWEPTETTRRMQLLAGGYLVLAGLINPSLTYLFQSYVRQVLEKSLQQNPSVTPDQMTQIVDLSVTGGLVVAVAFGAIYAVFGILTLLRRWGWLFYADLVILGLGGLGVFSGLFGLARGTGGPLGLVIPNLVLAAAALALFTWMLVVRIRGSVWAGRKVPNF
jgi:hypothetical protein